MNLQELKTAIQSWTAVHNGAFEYMWIHTQIYALHNLYN